MPMTLETLLIGSASLLIVSILASKMAVRFGIPALLLFILIGMGMGSEGFGGIAFDNPRLTQSVGVAALVLILFSGGLDTPWQTVKDVAKEGLLLTSVGVLVTALIVGAFVHLVWDFTWYEGILLGATIASTDAAAVFAVLNGKQVHLKGKLKPILELESGSNDPTAVFLTLSMLHLLTQPDSSLMSLIPLFLVQMTLGAVLGIGLGYAMVFSINRLRLEYDGLYPVLSLSSVLLIYGLTTVLGGNGFLAVYLAGLIANRYDFIHKNSLRQFHEGLAWLMQIVMFLVLGLQVFPSRLIAIAGAGTILALFLVLIARPLSVFLALIPTKLTNREKIFISWVGLRGAAPIILATFSQIAAVDLPLPIFDLVFFVVFVSVLVQGTTIIPVARYLGLYQEQESADSSFLTRIVKGASLQDYLIELRVTAQAEGANKRILDLDLPDGSLIVIINRAGEIIIPRGSTDILPDDNLLILGQKHQHTQIRKLFA